jgi:two-component system response regulator AtoC
LKGEKEMREKLLIVDDEASIRAFFSIALEPKYRVEAVASPDEAVSALEREPTGLVLLDLMLGEYDGMELLRSIKACYPDTAVIMMTAFGSINSSVDAIKNGAFTYLCKPVNLTELSVFIEQALEFRRLSMKVSYLSSELESRGGYGGMVGKSPAMQRVYELVERVKDFDTSVLISGESGTGKELVARAIHRLGARRDGRFVSVNCAAIPENLLEEEFFGHKRGAFTGAVSNSAGKLRQADGGTLFLDEIGDMPYSLQGKLLRALQEREYSPIGSSEVCRFDARILAASNKSLRTLVNEGKFREELYYRLRVMHIKLPPLSARREDIPLLCHHFIRKFAAETQKKITGITGCAEKALLEYGYPGNVRELVNAIEYAVVLAQGTLIDLCDLPPEFRGSAGGADAQNAFEALCDALGGLTLKDAERMLIRYALKKHDGCRRAAARAVGISERSLFYKLQEYER